MITNPAPPSIRAMHAVLPPRQRTSDDTDRWIGAEPGWTSRKTGVETRHVCLPSDTVASLGAQVVIEILEREGLGFDDIDAIVFASGSKDQFLPSTAALVSYELGDRARGIPAFDIDATCLSFVLALDLMNRAMATGMYRRIIVASAEMPSRGLDPGKPETAAIFGDAAVAAILEVGVGDHRAPAVGHIGHCRFETYGEGAHLTEVRIGTSRNPTTDFHHYDPEDFRFQMDGPAVYELASRTFPAFLDRFLDEAGMELADFDFVVPHQASKPAVELLARKLGIRAGTYAQDYSRFGNTVAASIPLSLHTAQVEGRVKPGDAVLLLGTAAGLTLGAMALRI